MCLNSTANNILITKNFQKKYSYHLPGDNGGCLGAAFYVSKRLIKNNNFNNPFIGNFYSDLEIEKIIYEKFSELSRF